MSAPPKTLDAPVKIRLGSKLEAQRLIWSRLRDTSTDAGSFTKLMSMLRELSPSWTRKPRSAEAHPLEEDADQELNQMVQWEEKQRREARLRRDAQFKTTV
jgi:hypothetical protein